MDEIESQTKDKHNMHNNYKEIQHNATKIRAKRWEEKQKEGTNQQKHKSKILNKLNKIKTVNTKKHKWT